MEFLTAVSSVAVGWGSYLKGFLLTYGIQMPKALNGTFDPQNGTYIDLLPVLVMIFVTGIVLMNSKSALRFNNILVVLKFSALALFLLVGIFFINTDNWVNFAPYGMGQLYGGKTGIFAGASVMFFAFLGFESISMTVDEVKDPQKTIPKGIIWSLIIVTILYVAVTVILTGMVYYKKLNVADAVAFALRSVGMGWAANYISIIAVFTLITVCITMTYALSRTVYSISRDGLLPKFLQKITKKNYIPKNATIFVGILAMICAGFIPLASLAEFVNICTLAYLIIMSVAIIKLRQVEGKAKDSEFQTPLVPLLPLLAILICISFMSQYMVITWLAFIITTLIGIIIYFTYGYKHSKI